ncbi:THAPSDRAFT_268027 [Thalassiosira pseudonana CCMP1335]|uniref:tRNA (guanine(37)-N(1))-methyltransferase n=1 Tax=Thalassiosira pseudonana TaxID=35128 RepID=TRM5_THAPS|nr:THAPSDRAFT_268027 [Thalassiosira pseudonana CCMP1335]B8BQY5.1 RecName: Full=tRNA (guanine(37)-N1)-methyltransferase; AltName: Full=M1G-methyltransferase; AltName: Full=tRNA [GM37] methyltransferase; AltName: Full=tRNA methyltransferase 5 homolog [Thalassiosira pseudonana]EED96442.1 Hypothetical protein THAPSDRAFT_268027 [Thalassiosira pseudonana CCMP1335]
MTHHLAPLDSLPTSIYPPSAYPPPSFFESSSLIYPALLIPAKRTGEVQKTLKDVIFTEPKRKSVYPLEEGVDYSSIEVSAEGGYDPMKERKVVLIRLGDIAGKNEEEQITGIKEDPVFQDARVKSMLLSAKINIGAEPSTAPNAATNVEEVPSSFEIAGHVAHVNLRSESLPYKYLIGKAILDKNPKLRVVVNKIGNIENEFRTFPMEILAGEGLDLDLLKEHGCRFKLDFAKVYWNSRLQGEHARLVQYITKPKECIVADAMAGVGPFAVPLTSALAPHYYKTTVVCHANDLNPISYKYLQTNAQLNRCFADRLITYNLDGREFIHKMNYERIEADHFIMNLPQMAPEFLDAFRGWKFDDTTGHRPIIHVHCFDEKTRNEEETARMETHVLQRCEAALGSSGCLVDKRQENDVQIRVVRDVGPRKNMLCVSFRLPVEVAGVEKLLLTKNSDAEVNGKRKRENYDCVAEVSNVSKKERDS